jgi:hypothetical protein
LENAVRLRRVDDGVSVVLLIDEIDELSSSSVSLVVKLCESWLVTKIRRCGKRIRNIIYLHDFACSCCNRFKKVWNSGLIYNVGGGFTSWLALLSSASIEKFFDMMLKIWDEEMK